MGGFNVSITAKETSGKSKWKLENDKNGKLTLAELEEFADEAVFKIARQALREEQARGFPKKDFNTITDGVVGKSDKRVSIRKRGEIQYAAPQDLSKVLDYIYRTVVSKSPRRSGRYKSSHLLMYRGKVVARTLVGVQDWAKKVKLQTGDFVSIINYQPYARMLERHGITKGKEGKSSSATRFSKSKKTKYPDMLQPNGAYYLTYLLARKKISKAEGSIKFSFLSGSTLSLPATQNRTTFARGKGKGRSYVYPTITLKVDTRGFK